MKNTLISIAAIVFSVVAILMTMSVNQKLMANCVVVEDQNTSMVHALESKNPITGELFLVPVSTKEFYQDRLTCITNNDHIGADIDTEIKQLQSLSFITKLEKNEKKGLCVNTVSDATFCAKK